MKRFAKPVVLGLIVRRELPLISLIGEFLQAGLHLDVGAEIDDAQRNLRGQALDEGVQDSIENRRSSTCTHIDIIAEHVMALQWRFFGRPWTLVTTAIGSSGLVPLRAGHARR
jgi:hypothetical protein